MRAVLRKRWFAVAALGLLAPAVSACSASSIAPSTAPRPAFSSSQRGPVRGTLAFTFTTHDDQSDPMFNELLGINNEAKLTGFYGSGSPTHPNRGYIVYHPYGQNNFRNEDYPGAVDTQVTAVNNKKSIAGFYLDSNGSTYGFVLINRIWSSYKDPHVPKGHGSVTELLGVNDAGVAVGFYISALGTAKAFDVDVATGKFHGLAPPGGDDAVATGITGPGDIVGYLKQNSQNVGFLLRQGTYTEFSFPGSTDTKFLGVTLHDQIVGSYVDSSSQTHGFLLTNPLEESLSWQSIDEPNAAGPTVVSGINLHDDLVGYYVDASGNTNGFLATLASQR